MNEVKIKDPETLNKIAKARRELNTDSVYKQICAGIEERAKNGYFSFEFSEHDYEKSLSIPRDAFNVGVIEKRLKSMGFKVCIGFTDRHHVVSWGNATLAG